MDCFEDFRQCIHDLAVEQMKEDKEELQRLGRKLETVIKVLGDSMCVADVDDYRYDR